jgi:lysophospholipase L1-like esterase
MNKIIWITVAALLALSLVGNVVLYRQCKALYLREGMQRLDPLGRAKQPRTTDQETGIHVVFFGDSRASQWVAPRSGGYRFSNHGIAGQTTEQIRLRTAAVLAEKDVDMVVVEAGMNDLKYIPWMPERRKEITERCIANLREIVARLRESGSKVVICTVFPCGEVPLQRRLWWSPEVDASIAAVNRAILTMGGEGVTVFDAHAVLVGPDGRVRKEFATDLLHVNAAAYAALNASLFGNLDKPR